MLRRIFADLRTQLHMARRGGTAHDHRKRLEEFYGPQAERYDEFRDRLLHGRQDLLAAIDIAPGTRMIDMGAGTARTAEFLGTRIEQLEVLHVVDLCPSLLEVARKRIRRYKWTNVVATLADATGFDPPGGPVDVVTFCYSLTMIPDWSAAVDQAHRMLKSGGVIGVADFYISSKRPSAGLRRHSWFQRFFWPKWFRGHVALSPRHLPYLRDRFRTVRLDERLGRVPFACGLRAPYYIYIGRKE